MMNETYKFLKNSNLCPKDMKYDVFQWFKNTLESNSQERLVLNLLLLDYPINDSEKEDVIIPYIEGIIDKIYEQLN